MTSTVQTRPLISMHPSATVQEAAQLMNDCRIAARDLMTSPALACRADAFFEEVAERLADGDISGMPVVDDQGFLVGVISERDSRTRWGDLS